MKYLAKTLIFASALCLLSGMAAAKKVHINCQDSAKCVHYEDMGKSQTDEFYGQCNGNIPNGMKMVCHPVKGMTCSPANPSIDAKYLVCECTNWSATKKQTATIDVLCPAAN